MRRSVRRGSGSGRLLVLCYALAVVLWLVYCFVHSAVALNEKANGRMRSLTLSPEDFTRESFVSYDESEWDDPPEEGENWYLSTDNDSHLFWEGEIYLERVRLDAWHYLPPGSVALYYLKPGQTDYSEAQKVFARVTGDGQYTFDLGGVLVSGLRIDPDNVGGVPTQFTGVQLNPPAFWVEDFLPDGGQWLVLLFGPALVAAFLRLLHQVIRGDL